MTQETLNEKLNQYEAVFARDPHDGVVSVARTYLYILSGRLQDALKSALEASLSVASKNLRVQVAIAMCYLLRSKPDEALVESRYALTIDPANPLCHLVQAGTLYALHRPDEARLAFLKGLALASDNTFVAALKLRNRTALRSAQERNPLLVAYSNLGMPAPDVAEAEALELVAQYPSDPVIKALLAAVYHRSGKAREALGVLETGLASYESFPERLYLLWQTYDEQPVSHERSSAFAKRLLEVDPLSDRAGPFACANLGDEALCHISFVRSLEDLPDSIFAHVLPVAELESLVGVSTTDVPDSASAPEDRDAAVRSEQLLPIPDAGSVSSYLPLLPVTPASTASPQGKPACPAASPPTITDPTSDPDEASRDDPTTEPLSGSIAERMEHLLEQARCIADSLIATPLPHTDAAMCAVPAPDMGKPLVPSQDGPPQVAPRAPATATEPTFQAAGTQALQRAETLLADGQFEEAMKAFLALADSG